MRQQDELEELCGALASVGRQCRQDAVLGWIVVVNPGCGGQCLSPQEAELEFRYSRQSTSRPNPSRPDQTLSIEPTGNLPYRADRGVNFKFPRYEIDVDSVARAMYRTFDCASVSYLTYGQARSVVAVST